MFALRPSTTCLRYPYVYSVTIDNFSSRSSDTLLIALSVSRVTAAVRLTTCSFVVTITSLKFGDYRPARFEVIANLSEMDVQLILVQFSCMD